MDAVSAIGTAMENESFGFAACDARGVLCEPGRPAFPPPQMNLPAEPQIDPLQLLNSVPPAPPPEPPRPQYCSVASLDLPPDAFRWKEAAQASQNDSTLGYEDCQQSNGLGGPGFAPGLQLVNNPLEGTPGTTMTVDQPMAGGTTLQQHQGATAAPMLAEQQFPELPTMENEALQESVTQDFYGVQEISPLGDTVGGEDLAMSDPGLSTAPAGMDAIPAGANALVDDDASPASQATPVVKPEEESELMNGVNAVTLSIERYQAARKDLREMNAGTGGPAVGALPESQGGGLGSSNLDMSVVTYAARNFRQVMEQETELLEANANEHHQLVAAQQQQLGGDGDDESHQHQQSFQKTSNEMFNNLSSIYNASNMFGGAADGTNNGGNVENGDNTTNTNNSGVDQVMQGVDAVDQLIQGGTGDPPGGENFSEGVMGLQNDQADPQMLGEGNYLQQTTDGLEVDDEEDDDGPPSFTSWANNAMPAPPIPPEDTHDMEQQYQEQGQYQQHQGQGQYQHQGQQEMQEMQEEHAHGHEQGISPCQTPTRTDKVTKATGLDERFGSGLLPAESSPVATPGNRATPTRRKRNPKTSSKSSKEHIIFDREQLTDLFDMSIDSAAEVLGVCTTVVKRQCRLHGIERWPARKLQALLRQISNHEKMRDTMLLVQRWRAHRGPWHGITDEQQSRVVHLYQLHREKHDIAKTELPVEWRMPAELMPEGSVGQQYVI